MASSRPDEPGDRDGDQARSYNARRHGARRPLQTAVDLVADRRVEQVAGGAPLRPCEAERAAQQPSQHAARKIRRHCMTDLREPGQRAERESRAGMAGQPLDLRADFRRVQ